MKGLYVAFALMLLTGSASAQAINMLRGDGQPKTMEQMAKEKEIEDAYKAKMKEIPDQKGSSDPWGNMRSADAPKTSPAPRKMKPQ